MTMMMIRLHTANSHGDAQRFVVEVVDAAAGGGGDDDSNNDDDSFHYNQIYSRSTMIDITTWRCICCRR